MNIIDQLIAEVQAQIDDVKPMAYKLDHANAYDHGWYNGNFAAWVEMRRRLKELKAYKPADGDVMP